MTDPASAPAVASPPTVVPPPVTSPPGTSPPVTTPPPKEDAKPAFQPIASQEDLDHVVFNRLKQQETSLRKTITDEVKTALEQESATKLAEEQGKFEDLYKAEQAKVAALEARVTEQEQKTIRAEVAAKYSLPPLLADRLRGDDRAALEADAKDLAKHLKEPDLDTDAGKRTRPNGGAGPAKAVVPKFGVNRPTVIRPGYGPDEKE